MQRSIAIRRGGEGAPAFRINVLAGAGVSLGPEIVSIAENANLFLTPTTLVKARPPPTATLADAVRCNADYASLGLAT